MTEGGVFELRRRLTIVDNPFPEQIGAFQQNYHTPYASEATRNVAHSLLNKQRRSVKQADNKPVLGHVAMS